MSRATGQGVVPPLADVPLARARFDDGFDVVVAVESTKCAHRVLVEIPSLSWMLANDAPCRPLLNAARRVTNPRAPLRLMRIIGDRPFWPLYAGRWIHMPVFLDSVPAKGSEVSMYVGPLRQPAVAPAAAAVLHPRGAALAAAPPRRWSTSIRYALLHSSFGQWPSCRSGALAPRLVPPPTSVAAGDHSSSLTLAATAGSLADPCATPVGTRASASSSGGSADLAGLRDDDPGGPLLDGI